MKTITRTLGYMRTVFAVLVALGMALATPLIAGTANIQLSTNNVCATPNFTIVSDTTNQYIADDNSLQNVVETYDQNWLWLFSADINNNDAKWIWPTFVADPAGETQTITKSFEINGNVKSASIRFLTDNSYKFFIGGNLVAESAELVNFENLTTIDVASYLAAGTNTLSFEITNESRPDLDGYDNPAGLKYVLEVETEICNTTSKCQANVFSGTDNKVSETQNGDTNNAVNTWDGHPAWTASVDNDAATWIWSDYLVTEPTKSQTRWFTKTFAITGNIDTASLTIAADNSYEVYVNNVQVGFDSNIFNFRSGDEDIYDLSTYLVEGVNNLAFKVTNQNGATPYSNPAGLLYSLEVVTNQDGDTCIFESNEIPVITVNPETITLTVGNPYAGNIYTDGVTANDVEDGDITADLVVGGQTVNMNVPGTYVILYDVTDSDTNNAVQKSRTVIVEPGNITYVCTEEFVSADGNTTLYTPNGTTFAVPAYQISSWGSIENATWIWEEYLVSNPTGGRGGLKMYRTINIPGEVINATATLGYDNRGDFTVNGTKAVDVYNNYFNFLPANIKTWDITNYMQQGDNQLEWTGHNNSSSVTSPYSNPAGVIYKVTVQYESNDPTCDPISDNIPVITVNPETITLTIGATAPNVLAGVTANDVEDGDVTADLVTTGTVDTNTIGTYIVKYDVVDSDGNNAVQKSRTYVIEQGYVNNPPVITVNPIIVNLTVGDTSPILTDGVSANDIEDGNITADIVVTGTVNTSVANTYFITYNVMDRDGLSATEKTRLYVVKPVPNEAPVVTVDPDTETFVLGQTYTGTNIFTDNVTATDKEDGDITANVTWTGNIDWNKVGTYIFTYSVTDSKGAVSAPATKTINIVAPTYICSDGIDNDNDGKTDSKDPACHTDGNPNNPKSYDPTINSENEAPVITLLGGNPLILDLGASYFEAGATLNDPEEGVINPNLVIDSTTVNTLNPGVYYVTYNGADNANPALSAEEVIRTVVVKTPGSCYALGKVTTNKIRNWDNGDTEDKVFVGGNTGLSTQVWFPIFFEDSAIVDGYIDTYADNNGLAIERRDGTVRAQLFGSHGKNNANEPTGKEHFSGYLEFINATPTSQTNDLAVNKVENPFNGTGTSGYKAGDDELWLNSNNSHFWLTVTTANDGFFTNFNVDCLTNEIPVITVDPTEVTLTIGATAPNVLAGVTANDVEDGDVTADITSSGSVDVTTVGNYTITYNVTDSDGNNAVSKTRTYTVKTGNSGVNNPPVLTVDPLTLQYLAGQVLTINPILSGVTANDIEDGNITTSIVVLDDDGFNINTVGIYIISYEVTDSKGAKATGTRTIYVGEVQGDNIPVITVNPETITLTIGAIAPNVLAGVTANDVEDGDVTADLVTTGTVDTNTIGTYIVKYDVVDSDGNNAVQKSRTYMVKAVEDPCARGCSYGSSPTNNKPVIVLKSNNPQQVNKGDAYLELGAIANDVEDGNGLPVVDIDSSDVNTNVIGTYIVRYNFKDSKGLAADQVVRQVVVGDVAGETFIPVYPNCELRFTKWMKRGDRGEHVADMQTFLNEHMKLGLKVDGVYGMKTFLAVQAYQVLNRRYVLDPWNLSGPSGWTYKTTRAKMNYDTGCAEPSKLLDHINREWITDFSYIGWVDERPTN